MMTDIQAEAITFECNYADRPAGSKESDIVKPEKLEKVPEFTDIRISDIVCRGASVAIAASGIEGLKCVHDITVENSTFIYSDKATEIDSATAVVTVKDVKFIPDRKL